MAQTALSSSPPAAGGGGGDAGGRATAAPFPAPPGLEAGGPGGGAGPRGETMEAVKQALLQDVDAKVGEKVEELWQRGKQMLGQVQKRQQENTDKLSAEITRCLEKQQALEADNEQLKQILAALASRLTLLGSALGAASSQAAASCAAAAAAAATTTSTSPGGSSTATTAAAATLAGTSPPTTAQARGSPSDPFSPAGLPDTAAGVGAAAAPLPEVPAFPFPATIGGSGAAPLSLAEALGQRTPSSAAAGSQAPQTPQQLPPQQQTPVALSLATSLPPALEVFSFTIRKADETDLGLNVSHHEIDRVLCVEGIRADGAVDAWNRQCMGSAFPEKAVTIGDRIISVNDVTYDPERMLKECKDKQLLKLTIFRGAGPLPELPTPAAAATAAATGQAAIERPSPPRPATAMRADASEFVPRGAAAAPAAATAAASPAATPAAASSGASGGAAASAGAAGAERAAA